MFSANAQIGNNVINGIKVNVKKFGAKGDGKTNDYFAIQKAILKLNELKTGILYFPAGIYKVDNYCKQNEYGKILNNINHFNFIGLTNFSIIGENKSVISIKGNYHKKSDFIGKGEKYGHSYDHQISFVFKGCKNITIKNIEINGNCDKMTRDENILENMSFGFIFGESFTDTVENVLMEDCYVHHISTDGVCWKGIGGNFLGRNLILKNNGRCAFSIVQGKNFNFKNCSFSETGVTGSYQSHSPNTGFDVENESFTTIENIFFDSCKFILNRSMQFIATGTDGIGAGRVQNIHLKNCLFQENRKIEPVADRAVCINTDNSSITNSIIKGTLNFDINGCLGYVQPNTGVLIRNCKIATNGYGIRLSCPFKVAIDNCVVEQNANLDSSSASLNFPFISTGKQVSITNNVFIYHSSNWRQSNMTMPWDYNNLIQGGESVSNNKFFLKEDQKTKLKKDQKYIITIDEKFIKNNQILGTSKIVFNQY
jgi:hypothetical protein